MKIGRTGFIVTIVAMLFWFLAGPLHAGDLAPEEAETMVKETVQKERQESLRKGYEKYGFLYRIDSGTISLAKYRELEKEGYIRILPYDGSSSIPSETVYGIQFTEKAGPYVTKSNGASEQKVYIDLAKVDTVKIMGLERTQPDEYRADVSLGLRLTPFGEVLLGRGVKLERKENVYFAPQDDGWRVKFRVSF